MSLDEPLIHRTSTIARSGSEFIGICLGFNEPQRRREKHTPCCKGAAKTDHGGEQQVPEPTDVYSHSTCHSAEHGRVTDDSRPREFFSSLANVRVRGHKGSSEQRWGEILK